MPGHNWAYSVAFPHLFANCSGEKGLPIQTEFWQDAFDPTQPALYEMIEQLLTEMAGRFPDSVIHLGGVSHRGLRKCNCWLRCSASTTCSPTVTVVCQAVVH